MYGDRRRYLGEVFQELVRRLECQILKGHHMPDHAHMLLSIPPKYVVLQLVVFMKGKGAIHIARQYLGGRESLMGLNFRARGFHIFTVGKDEEAIRKFIKEQEREDR